MSRKRPAYLKPAKDVDIYQRLQLFYEKGFNNEGKAIVILTDSENHIRERWEAAFTMLVSFHSPSQVQTRMQSAYKISNTQAMHDVRNATRLFGDINKSSREGKKYILYELAMKCFQLANECRPPKVDQMNAAVANMIKITGADKDEQDIPEYKKEEIKQVIIQLHPEILAKNKTTKDLEAEIKRLIAPKKKNDQIFEDAVIIKANEPGTEQGEG